MWIVHSHLRNPTTVDAQHVNAVSAVFNNIDMLIPSLLKINSEESDVESSISRSTEVTKITTAPALSVKLSIRASPAPRSASLAAHLEEPEVDAS